MSYEPDCEFAALFRAFTSDPNSIGVDLSEILVRQTSNCPLIVSTASDIAIFPALGRDPIVESFRTSTRGFIELTAISHLPLALAYLVQIRNFAPAGKLWRVRAAQLIEQGQRTRQSNTVAMWRDVVALSAFSGHEEKITDLVEYTLEQSISYLTRALADESLLSFESLISNYFDFTPTSIRPANMNDVMFATFALAYIDIAYRIGTWLKAQPVDWSQAMVLVTGQSGRPTAGTTWETNNMCNLIWRSTNRVLPRDRVYVAPHAASFSIDKLPDRSGFLQLEKDYRKLWCKTRASVEVSQLMFAGYKGYEAPLSSVECMPPVRGVDDRENYVARMRRIMEDPQQLISNCVADYIVDELDRTNYHPSKVVIPGFTNVNFVKSVDR
jgi:hypothetical protein